jgi:hypothetical protein
MDESRLYNLTPQEFERFVAELLPEAGYSDVRLVGGPGDHGIDLLGTSEGKTIAFQVKHKVRLSLQDIRKFAEHYFADPSVPRSLVFVTSADLPPDAASVAASVPPGAELRFLGRADILRLLKRDPPKPLRWFRVAAKRITKQRFRLWLSALGATASILGVIISLFSVALPPKETLDKRIETVERALSSIRDLEGYLSDIKDDMVATEKATLVINQKYTQAKELEKLTDQQIAALQETLQVQNWQRTVLNYVLGFVLGIASSLVASILYARWRQRKALQ